MALLKNCFMAITSAVAIALMGLSIALPPEFSIYTIIISIILAAACLIVGVILWSRGGKRRKRRKELFIYLAISFIMIAILLGTSFNFFKKNVAFAHKYDGAEVSVTGSVDRIRFSQPYMSSVAAKITEINGQSVNLSAIIEFNTDSPLYKLDIFTLVGKISPIPEDEAHLTSDGFAMKITVSDVETVDYIGRAAAPWYAPFTKLASESQYLLNSKTSDRASGLVGAMLLGNRDLLENETIRDFRRIGISHMLALSGLHVSVIIGFIDFALRIFEMDKKKRCVFLIIGALLYLAITGFSLSAARAVLMACGMYMAYIVYTDSDSLTFLFLAAYIILAVFPPAIMDIGFWMSLLATLGLIVISIILSPLHFKLKKKPLYVQLAVHLLSAVAVTIAATVAVSAFSLLVFKELSIISIVSNLIFSVPATLVLVLGLLFILFSWVPLLSELLVLLIDILSDAFISLASFLSNLHGITVSLNYEFAKYIIITMLALTLVFILIRLKHKWITVLPTGAAIIAFAICLTVYNAQNSGISSATYIKNSKSEMLTVVNTRSASICDISSGGYEHLHLAYKDAINKNATEIENLILTHYHQFHPSSLRRICSNYIVRNIYLPVPKNDKDAGWYADIAKIFEDSKTNIILYHPNEPIPLGEDCSLSVSEYFYIERSVHPMFFVTVTNRGESLVYLSSSIYESELFVEALENADHAIFGSHGPNIHNAPDYSKFSLSSAETVILSDLLKQLGETLPPVGFTSVEETDTYKFILDGK